MTYPPFDTLGTAPDYLWIGAVAMRNLRALVTPDATDRSQAHDTKRAYASAYVGVTKVKGRWVGTWGSRGAQQGPRRPLTDAGERQAACDRALVLGLGYLERRDGTREGV